MIFEIIVYVVMVRLLITLLLLFAGLYSVGQMLARLLISMSIAQIILLFFGHSLAICYMN